MVCRVSILDLGGMLISLDAAYDLANRKNSFVQTGPTCEYSRNTNRHLRLMLEQAFQAIVPNNWAGGSPKTRETEQA
jgi:hypothetical protein